MLKLTKREKKYFVPAGNRNPIFTSRIRSLVTTPTELPLYRVVLQEVLIPQPHLYSYRRLGDSSVVVNFTLQVSPVKFHGCLEGGEADAGKKEALQASDSMRCGAP